MRFDGHLGFPGGLVDDGITLLLYLFDIKLR